MPAAPLKRCTCCGAELTREEWNQLPPAPAGLRAMDLEWRTHSCGSTLVVAIVDLDPTYVPAESKAPARPWVCLPGTMTDAEVDAWIDSHAGEVA